MTSSPRPLHRVLRMAAPGLAIAWVAAAGLTVAGIPPEVPAARLWLGVGVGSLVGVGACAILEAAMRVRPVGAAGAAQAGMSVQVAMVATLLLKFLGVGALLLWGFSSGLKFPSLVTLGVAFAATAVCIQVLGASALHSLATRGAAARQGSGASSES